MSNTNLPPIDVRDVPLNEIKPAKYNPRFIKDENFAALRESLKTFGQRENLIINKDGTLISGHKRYEAMLLEGWKTAKCDVLDLKPALEKKLNLIMNNPNMQGEFDTVKVDEILTELQLTEDDLDSFRLPELGTLDLSEDEESKKQIEAHDKLAEKFIVPPFSVIDTRREDWQERKRTWLALGIKSEVGRDDDLLIKSSGFMGDEVNKRGGGTSVFDPALCEVLYTWFNQPAGEVLDPFAGGSVRGVVANKLGMAYTGIELRGEQVKANRENAEQIFGKPSSEVAPALHWLQGDSNVMLDELEQDYDLIFSCPPYADLEVYSKLATDLSNMPYPAFMDTYRTIIAKAISKLKPDRFACFVVSEVRDKSKGYYGGYYGFVPDTIKAFEDAGAAFYNEIILLNPAGTLPLRAGKQFNAGRKVGRMHQNVLVFYKGNVKDIKKHFGEIDISKLDTLNDSVVEL